MATTLTWEVNTMDRDLSDGFVTKVIYRIKGIENGTEKARETGEVIFAKPSTLPSDFKEYGTLSEADCITWVKDTLGTNQVTSIETDLTNKVDLINTPTTATGKPW